MSLKINNSDTSSGYGPYSSNYLTITGPSTGTADVQLFTSSDINTNVNTQLLEKGTGFIKLGSNPFVQVGAPTSAPNVQCWGTDTTGSPGNATVNKSAGRAAIAAGAASVTITNATVTSTSLVFAQLQTTDGTLTSIKSVVPSNGSFVITGNANATGNTNVAWFVVGIF